MVKLAMSHAVTSQACVKLPHKTEEYSRQDRKGRKEQKEGRGEAKKISQQFFWHSLFIVQLYLLIERASFSFLGIKNKQKRLNNKREIRQFKMFEKFTDIYHLFTAPPHPQQIGEEGVKGRVSLSRIQAHPFRKTDH